jgi:hypothetical protein
MIDELKFMMIAAPLPADSRYRPLLRQVLDRLPEGWDEFRTFGVEPQAGAPVQGYASAYRIEEIESADGQDEARTEQMWVVTVYPEWLDRFSDEAVRWVIVHELGHVASGCRCGVVIGGRRMTRAWGTEDTYRDLTPAEAEANERTADAIGRAWGFWSEEEQFKREVANLTEK